MMQKFHSALILFLLAFLIITTISYARKFPATQGEADIMVMNNNFKESVASIDTSDSFDELMGREECQNQDEECIKRRVIAEAHLDYIYTQHQRP